MDILDLKLIWHTKTLKAFNELSYDKILDASNIISGEMYIKLSKGSIFMVNGVESDIVDGFEAKKKHVNESVETLYFIPINMIKKMPFLILDSKKIRSNKKVYHVITDFETVKIEPNKIMTWREIIDYSGNQEHTNKMHYALFKNKCLYGRTVGQFYYRIITESAFGKDKYKESINLLLCKGSILSDPTVANLFYRACFNDEITINEIPAETTGKDFIQFCNILMRIGDGSTVIDNRARKTEATLDTADTSHLSVNFTQNVPEYYHSKGHKSFDDVYPYNIITRYYFNLYGGYAQGEFPKILDFNGLAVRYKLFIRNWIKSVLWYKENWGKIQNKYGTKYLDEYKFDANKPRFRDHFMDFAKCLGEYAKDESEYKMLLDEEYKSHKTYDNMLNHILSEEKVA